MGLSLRRRRTASPELQRSGDVLSLQQYLEMFTFNNVQYPFTSYGGTLGEKEEEPERTFAGYVSAGYKQNGVIFACMLARLLMFSEARFQFRQLRSGRPGDLFGTSELAILEKPWVNATTGDLLARMEQDTSLAGNFYALERRNSLWRMRPDWVGIVLGSQEEDESLADLMTEVLGYVYYPGGPHSGKEPVPLLPEEVCHYAPIPDPAARFRGMSWLTPVIRELMADSAMTTHKSKFLENGATPNLFIKLDPVVQPEAANKWIELFEQKFGEARGTAYLNAYKTLILGGGADVTPIGADMKQLDFKVVQGHGETRIAAAAGTPPVIVGLSEGLEAATYSNYALAMRRFADLTMRPLWRKAAGALATIIRVPRNAELWYDDRDIPALKKDVKDAAEVQQMQAATVQILFNTGFEPDAILDAVSAGDFMRLKGKHTGKSSVQLQPADEGTSQNGQVSEKDAQAALPAAS
jgi:phage portal protein BeeE